MDGVKGRGTEKVEERERESREGMMRMWRGRRGEEGSGMHAPEPELVHFNAKDFDSRRRRS